MPPDVTAAPCLHWEVSYLIPREDPLNKQTLLSVLKYVGGAVACLIVIIGVAATMKPVFVGQEPVARAIVHRDRSVASVSKPILEAMGDTSTPGASPAELAHQERAFYEDLVRTGRIDSARAQNIARVAVRE